MLDQLLSQDLAHVFVWPKSKKYSEIFAQRIACYYVVALFTSEALMVPGRFKGEVKAKFWQLKYSHVNRAWENWAYQRKIELLPN